MRYGYCINMLSLPGSDGSGREFLPMIAESGFDYAELPLAQMMRYDDDDFRELFLRPLAETGLSCRCCNNFFPSEIRLTGPEADHAAALDYAGRALERASRLGAEKVVFGSSGARNCPAGYSREAAMNQIRDFLALLEPVAAESGITIVLEHLNKSESNLINSLNEAIDLRTGLNLAHVENLLDHYHMILSGGSVDEIRRAGAHLKHVHLARTLSRSLPVPGDESGLAEMFGALREIHYNGDVSIEAYAPLISQPEAVAASLRYLKTIS